MDFHRGKLLKTLKKMVLKLMQYFSLGSSFNFGLVTNIGITYFFLNECDAYLLRQYIILFLNLLKLE